MYTGSPATEGCGVERYTARLIFEVSQFDQVEESNSSFELAGFTAEIKHHDHFHVLRVGEFRSAQEAENFVGFVRSAMIELSARKGASVWVSPIIPIDRNEMPLNVSMRDGLAEQHHPKWSRRSDGSVTDGGVWPHQSCILPEHERIWEYPQLWAKPVRLLDIPSMKDAVVSAIRIGRPQNLLDDKRLLSASKFLNLGNAEPNRELSFLLYAMVLEVLAGKGGHVGVGKVVAECRTADGQTHDETEGQELYRIRNKLVHEGILELDGKLLSLHEFSERYHRIRTLAGQGVILRLKRLSSVDSAKP
jgi:hypothetical protein